MPGPHTAHVHQTQMRLAKIEASLARLGQLSEANVLHRLAALEEQIASIANVQVALQEPVSDAVTAQENAERVPTS